MRHNDCNKILKNIDEPIAFVLGGCAATGLGVTRSFGRKGIPVVWLDSNQNQIGFLSKYCMGFVCPHPKNKEEEYIKFLLSMGDNLNNKGVLFPIGDVEVLVLLKNRRKLEKYYIFPMANLIAAKKLLNKHIFYEALEKQGISHPKTHFPCNVSELRAISKKINYPCIVKPSFSGYFRLDFKTKAFRAESEKQLFYWYNMALSKSHDVIVQEIIPGDARCMYGLNAYYDKNFSPNGVFTYRRIREWPIGFGNGCLMENVVAPELEKIVDPFIKKIKYHGIIDAEFKRDPRDDQFKLIEINARCWMQVSFPSRCGINLPYIAYMNEIGKNIEKVMPSKKYVKWLCVFEDAMSSLSGMLKGDVHLREWAGSFRGKKEYSIFAGDDPIPLLASIANSIYYHKSNSLRNYRY